MMAEKNTVSKKLPPSHPVFEVTKSNTMHPSSFHFKTEVLSMEVDMNDDVESYFRLRIGDQIKYISVDLGTFHEDILSFPPDLIDHLPKLPSGDWTSAHICRKSDHLVVEPSNKPLKGVTTC